MSREKEIAKIAEFFGEGWFEEIVQQEPSIAALPFEEQLKAVKQRSVHWGTSFFRDDVVLGVLERMVLADLPPDKTTHIASIGCSEGREPFSVLIQRWGRRDKLNIDAYDCNPKNIGIAKRGIYRIEFDSLEYGRFQRSAAHAEVNGILKTNLNGRLEINFSEDAKQKISFCVADITEGPLSRRYDAVLMLNVLFYYSQNGINRILNNVRQSLNAGGWLLCETGYDWPVFGNYAKWMRNPSGFENQEQLARKLVPNIGESQVPLVYRAK